jgi:hypothetical protein
MLAFGACYKPLKTDPAGMSPAVYKLFSGEILNECLSRFGVKAARLISDWHTFTFETETPLAPSILKVTHSSHRTYDQL